MVVRKPAKGSEDAVTAALPLVVSLPVESVGAEWEMQVVGFVQLFVI